MIVIDLGDRVWATYCRTNKRVCWDYSDYTGIWSSVEEAKLKIKESYPAGTNVQYRCENRATDELVMGEMTVD